MDQLSFDQFLDKTKQDIAALPEGAYQAELRLQVIALQHLVKGAPVSPETLAEAWGIPLEHVQAIFEQAAALGTLQLDDAGNMVGTAISLVPSKHKFQVGGKTLYAWCAYDAVYIPGVIGADAVIESVDPLNQQPIRLKISPGGVLESEPEGIVATVVGWMQIQAAGQIAPAAVRCTSLSRRKTPKHGLPGSPVFR